MNHIPSVFASKSPSLPTADTAFASFGCSGCGNDFSVQASLAEPFCVLCGCDDVVKNGEAVTASVHDAICETANNAVVECSGCSTFLVMSSAVEDNNVVYCSACGTDNHFESDRDEQACVKIGAERDGRTDIEVLPDCTKDMQAELDKHQKPSDRVSNPAAAKRNSTNEQVADLDDVLSTLETIAYHEDDDFDDLDNDDFDDLDNDDLDDLDDETAEFHTQDMQKLLDDDQDDSDRVSNPAAAERDDNNQVKSELAARKASHKARKKMPKRVVDDLDDEDEDSDMEKASVPGATNDQPEFNFPSEQEVFNNSVAKQKLEQKTVQPDGTNNTVNEDAFKTKPVSLLDIVRTSLPGNPPIRFGRVEASILAYVGPYTVAQLERDSVAASVRDQFDTQNYIQAIANSVQLAGLDETLANFGFNMLSVQTNSPALAALAHDRVEAKAQELAAQTNQAQLDEVQACLAIASTGYTKSFWANENPIRGAMVRAFEQAGFRNPHKTVDLALASVQDEYNRVLIAEAFNLLQMPVEARNAIAASIGASRHISERASAGVSEDNNVIASLSQPMRGVNEVVASVPSASSTGARSNAVQSTVARLKQSGSGLF